MRKLIGIIGILALSACGSPQRGGSGEPAGPVPELQRSYPALAWAPENVTYVATGKVRDMSFALREITTPLRLAPLPLDPDMLDGVFRQALGVSPLAARDLAEIGIAVDQAAAVFSTGLLPTIALPVEDPEALQKFLDTKQPDRNVNMKERDGTTVVSWQPTPDFAIAYARVDDWLLLHATNPQLETLDEWIDEMKTVRSRRGVAASQDLVAAANTARGWLSLGDDAAPAVLGMVRVPKLLEQIEDAGRCAVAVGGSIEGIVVGIDVTPSSGNAVLGVVVDEAAAAALAQHIAAPAPAGYRAYRESAGLYGDLALDLDWVDRALTANGCPSLPQEVVAVTVAQRQYGVRSVNVAITQLLLEKLKVQAAAFATLGDRRPIDQMLDEIPGRSLLEKSVTLGGVKAKSIDMGVVPRFVYRLTEADGLVAVGDRAIDTVFSGSGASDSDGALMVAAGIRPEKMPDLEAALAVIIEQFTPYGPDLPKRIAALYSRYKDAGFSVALSGQTIELRGWMTLAP